MDDQDTQFDCFSTMLTFACDQLLRVPLPSQEEAGVKFGEGLRDLVVVLETRERGGTRETEMDRQGQRCSLFTL